MDEVTEGRLPASQLAAVLVALSIKGYDAPEIAGFASVLARKKQPPRASRRGGGYLRHGRRRAGHLQHLVTGRVAGGGLRYAEWPSTATAASVLPPAAPTSSPPSASTPGCRRGRPRPCWSAPASPSCSPPPITAPCATPPPVRAELGIKTVLNLLGPLVNPAQAEYQLIGVYERALCEPVARAARLLGVRRVLVVHGADGQDEISVTGPTTHGGDRRGRPVPRARVRPREL